MSATSRGLGRGLDALFQNTPAGAEEQIATKENNVRPLEASIDSIIPNPKQPRHYFQDTQMDELAASIKSQGILQPILVRPLGGQEGTFEIVAGERRWRAAKKAGLATVPIVVRRMSDQEVLVVALMENLQREDLNPMEEALGLQQLKDEFGLSQEEMAERLGKSRSAIANTIRLASLPHAAQEDVASGRISAGHARALLAINDPETLDAFREYLILSQCTVREAEKIAAHWKTYGALPDDMTVKFKKSDSSRKGVSPLCEVMATIQEKICTTINLPVVIKGGENKGRISVNYSSREELDAFLAKLGLGGENI